jgi:hypothetical protein
MLKKIRIVGLPLLILSATIAFGDNSAAAPLASTDQDAYCLGTMGDTPLNVPQSLFTNSVFYYQATCTSGTYTFPNHFGWVNPWKEVEVDAGYRTNVLNSVSAAGYRQIGTLGEYDFLIRSAQASNEIENFCILERYDQQDDNSSALTCPSGVQLVMSPDLINGKLTTDEAQSIMQTSGYTKVAELNGKLIYKK